MIGNFEMDYNDGEVRYKTSIDVEGGELSPKMIENMMQANLMTMDRYFPGLMSVLYGGRDPAESIAEIEGGHSEDAEEEDELPNFHENEDEDEDEDEGSEGKGGDGDLDFGDSPEDKGGEKP